MNGFLIFSSISLSALSELRKLSHLPFVLTLKFLVATYSFFNTFIAYVFSLSFFFTIKTFPKVPLPITLMILKSSFEIFCLGLRRFSDSPVFCSFQIQSFNSLFGLSMNLNFNEGLTSRNSFIKQRFANTCLSHIKSDLLL